MSPRQEQTHQGDTESTEKTQTRTLLSLLCHWIGVGDRYHNKELDPPTHCACGSSSVNESLKYLLTSLRLPSIVVILTRWWFLFVFVHHFGIVLRWAIVVAALLRKRATRDQNPSQYRQQNFSQLTHDYFAASLRPLFHA